MTFQEEILAGIPAQLPEAKPYNPEINHAPRRKDILTPEQKVLALKNALREKRGRTVGMLIAFICLFISVDCFSDILKRNIFRNAIVKRRNYYGSG